MSVQPPAATSSKVLTVRGVDKYFLDFAQKRSYYPLNRGFITDRRVIIAGSITFIKIYYFFSE